TTLKRDCDKATSDISEMVANLSRSTKYLAEVTFNLWFKVKILRYLV
ncbi:hypothetical protein DOY81_010389, partial [Sarcophaga bullata]